MLRQVHVEKATHFGLDENDAAVVRYAPRNTTLTIPSPPYEPTPQKNPVRVKVRL